MARLAVVLSILVLSMSTQAAETPIADGRKSLAAEVPVSAGHLVALHFSSVFSSFQEMAFEYGAAGAHAMFIPVQNKIFVHVYGNASSAQEAKKYLTKVRDMVIPFALAYAAGLGVSVTERDFTVLYQKLSRSEPPRSLLRFENGNFILLEE